jgi:hypothetical protein
MNPQLTVRRHSLAFAVLVLGAAWTFDASIAERSAERLSGWEQYRDRELGLTVDLPFHVFPRETAEQKESATAFSTPDGRARIRLSGFTNEDNETPSGYLNRIARFDAASFTYIRATSRFFVASGISEDMIFYRRCNFSKSPDKRIGCVQLDYPEREKRAWDDIVTRISLSLRMEGLD